MPLSVVVASACSLCNFVLREYQKIADYVTGLIGYCLLCDEVDSNLSLSIIDESRGEQYLRRLFLVMKEQGMLNGCEICSFIGSRQQCLYGCLCIVLLLFSTYEGDSSNIPNVDWVDQVVMNGGCSFVLDGGKFHQVGGREGELLLSMNGSARKSVAMCVFDLVNMKNPSGGMTGPGNCMCFNNMALWLTGMIGKHHKKLIKNHAFIHNACGFMMNMTNIGPGYMFGLSIKNCLKISSSSFPRSSIYVYLSTISWLGQVSGLFMVSYLMDRLKASFFNTYDQSDEDEHVVVMKKRTQ